MFLTSIAVYINIIPDNEGCRDMWFNLDEETDGRTGIAISVSR